MFNGREEYDRSMRSINAELTRIVKAANVCRNEVGTVSCFDCLDFEVCLIQRAYKAALKEKESYKVVTERKFYEFQGGEDL